MERNIASIEIEAIKLILNHSINELGILQGTLRPTQPHNVHYKCLKISNTDVNQNIWKQEHKRNYLEYVFRGTAEELDEYGTFGSLMQAADEAAYVLDEWSLIPFADRNLKSKAKKLVNNLRVVKLTLFDWKNPWEKVKWEAELEKEEDEVKLRCSNREKYFGKLMEAKHEGCLMSYKLLKERTEDKCQNVQWQLRLEDRCTREMQSFLTLSRMELDAEFERCLLLQEELTVEKENKAQFLRIKREQLIEDTETARQLLITRAAAYRKFRRNYEHFKKKKEAIATVQTWWRAVLTTKKALEKFRCKKNK